MQKKRKKKVSYIIKAIGKKKNTLYWWQYDSRRPNEIMNESRDSSFITFELVKELHSELLFGQVVILKLWGQVSHMNLDKAISEDLTKLSTKMNLV